MVWVEKARFIREIGGSEQGLREPHVLIGVTSPQTCLVLLDRVRGLRAAGFRVSVICGPGKHLEDIVQCTGADAFPIRVARSISPISDAKAFVKIWGLLRRLRPDLVEFSTPKMGLLGSVAAWFCGIRARIYMLRGLRLETCEGIKRTVLLWAERLSGACASVVLCNSRSLMERAASLRIASSERLVLLGEGSSNGVDEIRFSPGESNIRERYGIPAAAKVIGFVGRLTGDKGLPELVEAFSRVLREVPDAFLLLVGWFDAAEDSLKCKVRARVEGHPRMVLTGYIDDVAPYYRAMDVLVLPSWREGFPNAILEASASGVPVVATSCTGSRDAVSAGETGLLIPPGDPRALANAITEVLSNESRRREMGELGRNRVLQHFRSSRVLGLVVSFYEELLASRVTEADREQDAATELTELL